MLRFDRVKTPFMVRQRLTTNGLSVRPEHGRRAPIEFSDSLALSMTFEMIGLYCDLKE
jgi:hypothetical protein